MRQCALCYSSQPLAALGAWGTSLACTDIGACEQRALASGMYPQAEDELGPGLQRNGPAWSAVRLTGPALTTSLDGTGSPPQPDQT
jgi:hypothetical protein